MRACSGRAQVDVGSPAGARAWVDVAGERLVVSVQSPGDGRAERELDRFALSGDGARAAARRLCAQLQRDFGYAEADPLFIALIGAYDRGDG